MKNAIEARFIENCIRCLACALAAWPHAITHNLNLDLDLNRLLTRIETGKEKDQDQD